jgi:hypothetical protein
LVNVISNSETRVHDAFVYICGLEYTSSCARTHTTPDGINMHAPTLTWTYVKRLWV